MGVTVKTTPKVLGDLVAEHDTEMLQRAFYETCDYKSLLQTTDCPIVVGRRGTGKSALAYRLEWFWRKDKDSAVVNVTPDETQVYGLRKILALFGDTYPRIRAASKVVWTYALLMEIGSACQSHFKALTCPRSLVQGL